MIFSVLQQFAELQRIALYSASRMFTICLRRLSGMLRRELPQNGRGEGVSWNLTQAFTAPNVHETNQMIPVPDDQLAPPQRSTPAVYKTYRGLAVRPRDAAEYAAANPERCAKIQAAASDWPK